jgi:cell wall-associated NlpC family hydrolase
VVPAAAAPVARRAGVEGNWPAPVVLALSTASIPLPLTASPVESAAAANLVAAAHLAPSSAAHGLAASVPAPASSTGRRETFVPVASASAPRATSGRAAAARPVDRPASARVASLRPAVPTVAAAEAAPRAGVVASTARRVTMLTVVCGILATSVIPVLSQSHPNAAFASTAGVSAPNVAGGAQTFDVSSASVNTAVAGRDAYGATSVLDYEKQVIANRQAAKSTTYTGPTAAEYLEHPIFPKLDRAEVFQVALQYLGTPYVHGGADPSAFDCSGLIMFVYAQFGISLPHYVPSQDAMGTTIPQSEAVPGDLVVFNTDDHDGIYAGNGMILDAPKPGGFVSVRPIWDAPHHFVRIGG